MGTTMCPAPLHPSPVGHGHLPPGQPGSSPKPRSRAARIVGGFAESVTLCRKCLIWLLLHGQVTMSPVEWLSSCRA
jgi:hypothetical protein